MGRSPKNILLKPISVNKILRCYLLIMCIEKYIENQNFILLNKMILLKINNKKKTRVLSKF
ncbi:hypothetical protein [Spiroplasma ixodetis]|uniref:hypothetical protein n=1 Tax=Spiroplasma ixodetis TaxID=2141 RepID=UPI002492B82B|nr:hypothetical protein [Spiroplasma ixodetis]